MKTSLQTGLWALVPVKSLDAAKQRLSGILDPDSRRSLSLAMLYDVLAALRSSDSIERVLVVTQERTLSQTIVDYDAELFVAQENGDVSVAIEQGCNYAKNAGANGVLIIHADLPLMQPDTIDHAWQLLRGKTMVLGPDRHGTGTNLLGLSPIRDFRFHYGKDSFQAHFREAESRGIEPVVFRAPDIDLDIDTPECLYLLTEQFPPAAASHTAAFVRALQASGQLHYETV